ncbi:MAG: FAD:protein FMN transferase, partial [Pirellulales bacterium]|nr:FAD:protein FMN transferase [Pirellulales bacterium]
MSSLAWLARAWGGLAASLSCILSAAAAEPVVLAGPAMGTTYRAVLAADVPGRTRGELHREIETVLAELDAAASTWRDDSDVSRFNRAGAGEWIEVGDDLFRIVATARQVHAETAGAFDPTVGPLVRLWQAAGKPTEATLAEARTLVGMTLIESRPAADGQPAALRKLRAGVRLDLGGIGPGYGVDSIGARLAALGSRGHLVELGGEARAWGTRPDGTSWRVRLPEGPEEVLELPPGRAVAFATVRPGRGPIDPRSGRPVTTGPRTVRATAGSCSRADARAVAVAVGWTPP